LIWEERNSGHYEHARACRERAPKKFHQPSNDIRKGDRVHIITFRDTIIPECSQNQTAVSDTLRLLFDF
jgi:hypothetical protein